MADYHEGYSEERYGALGGQKILEEENQHYWEMLEGLGAEEGDRILELGSNDALLSEYLSDTYEMHCADLEKNPLMDAREKGRAEQQYQVDGHRLPFKQDSFDYVIMPRMLHLDAVEESQVLEEAARVADKGMAFDSFSRFSGRALYNPVMHRINERMPKSNLSSKPEIHGIGPLEGWLEGIEYKEFETFSDFFMPFGAYKKSDKEAWVDFTHGVNEVFEKWGKTDLPDPNSVIYTSVELED
ncbi:MAG: class I SAM-dependent methyltransferase [Candidatus Nanosalina sp.]